MSLRIAYLIDAPTVEDARFLRKLLDGPYDPTLILFHSPSPEVSAFLGQFPTLRILWHPYPIAPPTQRPRFLGPWRRGLATWRAVEDLRADLRALRPGLLHAGWVQTCGAVAALSGFRPIVLMPWGSDILLWPKAHHRERWFAQIALRAADAVTCDAEAVSRVIRTLCPIPDHRFCIFPWGIELNRFHPGLRDPSLRRFWGFGESFVLIMTRSFEPVYGVEHFLQAFALLHRRHPHVRAVLVGGGSLESRLKAESERLGMGEFIRFSGRVPNHEMGRWVASADLYVSSSLSDGTSLSLLEAMASGLPAVVTDLPANREWVVEGLNGMLVPAGSPAVFADACSRLVQDPALGVEMGRRNLALARERADWDRNFARCAALYERLAGGGRRGERHGVRPKLSSAEAPAVA
ncbi:MAG: glycosyltransferase family 4 protein [Planctomycetes bacterium]|nr:glycosyltransferase family 4 protein [Planctomycetota bacterium]